jgi:hypothetical protein
MNICLKVQKTKYVLFDSSQTFVIMPHLSMQCMSIPHWMQEESTKDGVYSSVQYLPKAVFCMFFRAIYRLSVGVTRVKNSRFCVSDEGYTDHVLAMLNFVFDFFKNKAANNFSNQKLTYKKYGVFLWRP